MVFSTSDSQTLFTKGQFPCLYYMPACLSRLPCVSFEILSVVHPRATAWPSPPQGGARISTKILHFVQNDGPGRKAPQRVASFPGPMTPMQHRPPCHFDRSGEISLLHGTSRTTAGDLSTQSFNRVQAHLPPLRHAAPLEMTDTTGRLASLEENRNAVASHPCHFERRAAQK